MSLAQALTGNHNNLKPSLFDDTNMALMNRLGDGHVNPFSGKKIDLAGFNQAVDAIKALPAGERGNGMRVGSQRYRDLLAQAQQSPEAAAYDPRQSFVSKFLAPALAGGIMAAPLGFMGVNPIFKKLASSAISQGIST
jgi:hypothetical protein